MKEIAKHEQSAIQKKCNVKKAQHEKVQHEESATRKKFKMKRVHNEKSNMKEVQHENSAS